MNLTATLGAMLIALSVLVFIGNVAWSLRRGTAAGDNPWGASTLEWATSSPPPVYNFAHTPFVRSREPLWEEGGELPVVYGLRVDQREQLVTSTASAEPRVREPSPEPSIWPFLAAIATTLREAQRRPDGKGGCLITLPRNVPDRLKALRGLTPYEAVCQVWTKEPERFRLDPSHHTTGLNT